MEVKLIHGGELRADAEYCYELQIPKKPSVTVHGIYHCPHCSQIIWYKEEKCPLCQQMLDWREEE